MLVLSRREGERIFVGPNIVIQIVRVRGGSVRVGIEAPDDVRVVREELLEREDED
jgi:carbon storage regulator